MKKTVTLLKTPRFSVHRELIRQNGHGKDFYYLKKPDAVLIVPFTDRDIVLLRVIRPLMEKSSIELPGGRIESGESPLRAAKRELREECSLTSNRWRRIACFFALPSITTERVYVYSAEVEPPLHWKLKREGYEGIARVFLCPKPRAKQFALRGAMQCASDALSVLTFLSNTAYSSGQENKYG
jgi:ADP-ribose diphosphatase